MQSELFRRISNADHKDTNFDGGREQIGKDGFIKGTMSFVSKTFLPVSGPVQPVTGFLGLSRCIAPYS